MYKQVSGFTRKNSGVYLIAVTLYNITILFPGVLFSVEMKYEKRFVLLIIYWQDYFELRFNWLIIENYILNYSRIV